MACDFSTNRLKFSHEDSRPVCALSPRSPLWQRARVSTTAFGIWVILGLAVMWAGLVWMLGGRPPAGPPKRPAPLGRRADGGRRRATWPMRRSAHSVVISALTVIAAASLVGDLAARQHADASLPTLREGTNGSTIGGADTAVATSVPTLVPNVSVTAIAVGDLTECPRQDHSIAELARQLPGPILAVGDIVDPDGSAAHYTDCYEPLWGDLKSRIWPVPGNHDYASGGADPYFSYFGERAGAPDAGYYAMDLGAWRVIGLNSMCQPIGGCRPNSDQARWLATELAEHPSQCILAFWHHPLRSSGDGASDRAEAFWDLLFAAGADVIVNGHDHHYERFKPMTPGGVVDAIGGIRQFTVGTGGGSLTGVERVEPHSEVINASHGVLVLTLHSDSYDWEFVPADNGGFTDRGHGDCDDHGAQSQAARGGNGPTAP